ncbi:hypothetical protein OIU74_017964 [Salix koriyanagi]|uniref:Uncharacterized protein n=1 Tax=Salix koriyanagi TaxID=2511006 RepID=A0A9Q1AHQ8_9ROSI|nr:hypothetical protein OIU74_017964 [Salix koriyanagi]
MPDQEAKCFHGCLASILCEFSSSILSAQHKYEKGEAAKAAEAAGKESVKNKRPKRVHDGRLIAASDVARERNVKDVEESSHFKLLRPKITAGELQQCKQRCEEEAIKEREREQERGGNEKVRDCEEEKRILGKSSRSAVNSAKNQNRASNPSVKGGAGGNMREDRGEEEKEHGRGRKSSKERSREYEEQPRQNPCYFHSEIEVTI